MLWMGVKKWWLAAIPVGRFIRMIETAFETHEPAGRNLILRGNQPKLTVIKHRWFGFGYEPPCEQVLVARFYEPYINEASIGAAFV